MKNCIKCGELLGKNATFCPKCSTLQPKNKEPWKIVLIVLGVILFIGVVGAAISEEENSLSNENTQSSETTNQENNKQESQPEESKTEEPKKSDEEIKAEKIKELKDNCKKIKYKEAFRYAEDHHGELAKFTGEIIQITESTPLFSKETTYDIRMNVTKNDYGYYEDTIYIKYKPMEGATRVLEDDIVTVYGTLSGLKTYTTVLGAETTIPYLESQYMEIKK